MKTEVINLFYSRHITISEDIIAVMQNARRIIFSGVVIRLHL